MVRLEVWVAFSLLILVILGSALYSSHHHTSKSPASSLPADWIHYTSKAYGFQFYYPKSWGDVNISTTNDGNGTHYHALFSTKAANAKRIIGMNMDGACSATCLDAQAAQHNIKVGAKNFIKYDGSSYAFVINAPGSKISSLTEVKIVNLAKIKVTAVSLFYSIPQASNCPTAKFDTKTSNNCVTLGDYNTVNQVLSTLKSV